MHQIALAYEVGAYGQGLVLHRFVVQHSSPAPALVEQRIVPGRKDILGSEDVQIVRLFGIVGHQGSPVGEFGVRSLAVEHLHVPGCLAPRLIP